MIFQKESKNWLITFIWIKLGKYIKDQWLFNDFTDIIKLSVHLKVRNTCHYNDKRVFFYVHNKKNWLTKDG